MRKGEGIVPKGEPGFEVGNNGFEGSGCGWGVFAVDGFVNTRLEFVQGDAGEEVPWLVRSDGRVVVLNRGGRKGRGGFDRGFICEKAGAREVELGQQVAFEEYGVP